MSDKRIIGLIDREQFFPMYAIILYVDDNKVFARYPGGDECRITNTEEDCLSRPSFVRIKGETILHDKDIAFVVSEDEIYIEPVEKILERIQALLESGRFKDDPRIVEILEQILSAK